MNRTVPVACFWCKKEMNQRIDTFTRQLNKYGHSCCKRCFGKEQSFKDARSRVMNTSNPFKGRCHTEATRLFLSEKRIGVIPWNKGMRSYKRPIVPGSINKWMAFKKTILERDCNTCWKCGSKNRIEAHHMISKTRQPEFKYNPKYIITLCYWCHEDFHKEFTIRSFKPHETIAWLNRGRDEANRVFMC